MSLIDSVTSILGKAIDSAPAVFQIINQQQQQSLQRDLIKAQIAAIGRPVGIASAPPTARFADPRMGLPAQVPGQFRVTDPVAGGGAVAGGPFVRTAGLDIPGMDIGPQGSAALFSPFIPSMAGARAQRFVAVNPISGRMTWFGPIGRPILFSGDVTASKRVKRVARMAARASRGRR